MLKIPNSVLTPFASLLIPTDSDRLPIDTPDSILEVPIQTPAEQEPAF